MRGPWFVLLSVTMRNPVLSPRLNAKIVKKVYMYKELWQMVLRM